MCSCHSPWGGRKAERAKSFWQTAPGVITAVATLITAIGGVLGILVQDDIIGRGRDAEPSSPPPAAAGTTGEGGAESGSSGT